MTTVDDLLGRFRIPLIAAPMTGVSGLELMRAAASAGIGASFPVHNAPTPDDLDDWLNTLMSEQAAGFGPVIPNLIVRRTNEKLDEHVDAVIRHRVPAVITSVGSPAEVVEPLHHAGIVVFADIASLRHAERAIAAGVDGLVLLAAGAGGNTGWANPLTFARAVRRMWSGPLVLAGGVVDGASMLAALVAGYDLVYMGTPFIATVESAAAPEYKEAIVKATLDDIDVTSKLTGLRVSMIRGDEEGTFRFSAGHSVSGVDAIVTVAELVARVEAELSALQIDVGAGRAT